MDLGPEPHITDLATEAINAVNDYEKEAFRDRYRTYCDRIYQRTEEPNDAAD